MSIEQMADIYVSSWSIVLLLHIDFSASHSATDHGSRAIGGKEHFRSLQNRSLAAVVASNEEIHAAKILDSVLLERAEALDLKNV